MNILSYNIHRCSQEKIDHVLSKGADIVVLPECACPDQVSLPDGYEMTWVGQYDFKGLGVIWKSTVKCSVAPWADDEHKYMIPLIVNDEWLLLAAWPTIVPGIKKTYPQILLECLKAYSGHIKEMPTMITGDFNCYIGQGGVSEKTGTFEQCIEYMQELGLRSEYHERTHEEFGKESTCTYHHQFKDDMPFFIDFTFTNIPLFAYMIGGWERNMSDHKPQIIVIYGTMSKRFFNPYIGKSYQTGILGKNILVIGASHYCDKTNCPYFIDCTNEDIKDSSRYDNICWEYQRKGLKQSLSDNTIESIENEETAYRIFAKVLSQYVNVENHYDVWEYVAFANYVQFLLPHKDTYDYDVSDRDFEAFMETLQDLDPIPDIIIVWGVIVNRYLKQDNPYIVDQKEQDETEGYLCHMREPKSNKKIAIVNPYHPSSIKYWYNNIDTFKLYLEKAFAEQ